MIKRMLCLLLALLLGAGALPAPMAARAEKGQSAWCCYDGTVAVLREMQSFDDIGKLRLGDKVTLLERKDGWARIRNRKGKVGWTLGETITTQDPVVNQTVYAQVSDRIFAREPGGSAGLKVRKKVKRGAKLTLVCRSEFWARVKYRGKTYFTPAIYLAGEKPPKAGRVVVTKRRCDLRGAPKIGAKAIGALSKGTKLRLLTGGPLFAKVASLKGKTLGWVLVSQLKAD